MGRRRRGDWDASNLWDSLDSKTLKRRAVLVWSPSRNDNIERNRQRPKAQSIRLCIKYAPLPHRHTGSPSGTLSHKNGPVILP